MPCNIKKKSNNNQKYFVENLLINNQVCFQKSITGLFRPCNAVIANFNKKVKSMFFVFLLLYLVYL